MPNPHFQHECGYLRKESIYAGVGALRYDTIGWDPVNNKGTVYKSIDSGETWIKINTGFNQLPEAAIYRMVFGEINTQTGLYEIYAATYQGIFKSEDGGVNWVAKNNGLPPLGIAHFILKDMNNNDILYATLANKGIYRSLDRGENWSAFDDNLGLMNRNLHWLASDSNGRLLMACQEYGSCKGIWSKQTVGQTITDWTKIASYESLLIEEGWQSVLNNPTSIAVDPSNPNIIYASGSVTVYKSEDAGITWTQIYTNFDAAEGTYSSRGLNAFGASRSIAVDPKDPQKIYADR